MPTLLPTDQNNQPIPAVRLRHDGAHKISVSNSAARNQTAFNSDTKVISIYATVPVYIAFGDETIIATSDDHYFPAGIYYDVAVGGGRSAHNGYISALRVSGDGMLYISEKE